MLPEQTSLDIETSELFERSWIILTNPSDYTEEEVDSAFAFFSHHLERFEILVRCPPDPDISRQEIDDRIFMGVHHLNLRYPRNYRARDFREN